MRIAKLPQAAHQAAGGRGARCKPPAGWGQAHFKQEIAGMRAKIDDFFGPVNRC